MTYRRVIKPVIDRAAAAVLLAVLAPLLALVAIAVAIALGRPVLFRQQRPGRGGRPFLMFKFRTMLDARDAGGRQLPDADRLTAFGRFLRATSLDELPELVNVLRGEMSLVGPRPLLMEYLPRYSPEQARRHDVSPGITGWAQINGRNAVRWDDKFRMDVWYVDHASASLDVQILLTTAWRIVARQGISEPGHSTASEFLGPNAIAGLPLSNDQSGQAR